MAFEPRPQPGTTIDALVPPLGGFPYFANADQFPFEAQAEDVSPVNSWWLADASFLVYGAEDFIRKAVENSPLPAQGFELEVLGTPGTIRGIVLSNPEVIVVAFRGTRLEVRNVNGLVQGVFVNERDLVTDSRFFTTKSEKGGRVHTGFLEAFQEVARELDRLLADRNETRKVWLAGHSLGGALATLAAAHLGPDVVQGLYTYGCPVVGDADFVATLPTRSFYRFVHGADLVATQSLKLLGYRTAGELVPVTGDSRKNVFDMMKNNIMALASSVEALAQTLPLNLGALPGDFVPSLADHAPVFYATYLWNSLISGRDGNP